MIKVIHFNCQMYKKYKYIHDWIATGENSYEDDLFDLCSFVLRITEMQMSGIRETKTN